MSRDKLLNKWINILGLQDWHIELYSDCSPKELFDKDAQGENYYNFIYKYAKIRIISEKDRKQDILPLEYEHLLVHELLHCKFASLDDSGNALQDKIVHQLVEDFADILVNRCKNDDETTK